MVGRSKRSVVLIMLLADLYNFTVGSTVDPWKAFDRLSRDKGDGEMASGVAFVRRLASRS